MFEALNLIWLAGSMLISTTLYTAESRVNIPSFESGSAIVFNHHREWWRDDGQGKCVFKTVAMPFDRNWDEELNDHRSLAPTIRKAEPGVAVGVAYVVTRKVCAGKPDEPLLLLGDQWRVAEFRTGGALVFTNALLMEKDKQPKWLVSILDRAAKAAENDPVVAAELEAAADGIALARGIADGSAQPLKAE